MDLSKPPDSLCQPDPGKSCGACCGLYNYRTNDRARLEDRLRRRTERFSRVRPESPEALDAFSGWVRESEPEGKLLKTIYNCEFLGFLEPSFRTVGCLLHPGQNCGKDLRGCSFYGAELCAGHLCLSYQKLTLEEKWCVVSSLDDWFLYGICITDIDLVKRFFHEAAMLLGVAPPLSCLMEAGVREAARDFFSLKVEWPFRSGADGRFGKYCLAEDEYREFRIPYERMGVEPSRYDAILLSLESEFSSAEELRSAEARIGQRITAFAEACSDRL